MKVAVYGVSQLVATAFSVTGGCYRPGNCSKKWVARPSGAYDSFEIGDLMNKKTLSLGCLSLLTLAAHLVLAAPVVNSVTGSFAHGATFTVVGQNFGTKSPAAPMKYDSFQDGTAGQTLDPGFPPWNLWASPQPNGDPEAYYPKYSNDIERFPGDVASRQTFGPRPTGGFQGNCTIGLNNLQIGRLHVIGWAYWVGSPLDGGVQGPRNVKVWQNCVGEWGAPTTRYGSDSPNGPESGHIYAEACQGGTLGQAYGVGQGPGNQWMRFEIWHDRGAAGRPEVMSVIRDGVQRGTFTNAYSGCDQNRLYLMSYFDQNNNNQAWMNWYWSELYIDNTLARVEIGDATTWSACRHREVQIPQQWNGSAIVANFNQGSFSSGDRVYLYVFDESGLVNPTGYELVVEGDVHDPGPPGAPEGVVIVD